MNYLGNGIIDPLLKNVSGQKFIRIDKYRMNIFPEIKNFENNIFDHRTIYQRFYFQKGSLKK